MKYSTYRTTSILTGALVFIFAFAYMILRELQGIGEAGGWKLYGTSMILSYVWYSVLIFSILLILSVIISLFIKKEYLFRKIITVLLFINFINLFGFWFVAYRADVEYELRNSGLSIKFNSAEVVKIEEDKINDIGIKLSGEVVSKSGLPLVFEPAQPDNPDTIVQFKHTKETEFQSGFRISGKNSRISLVALPSVTIVEKANVPTKFSWNMVFNGVCTGSENEFYVTPESYVLTTSKNPFSFHPKVVTNVSSINIPKVIVDCK